MLLACSVHSEHQCLSTATLYGDVTFGRIIKIFSTDLTAKNWQISLWGGKAGEDEFTGSVYLPLFGKEYRTPQKYRDILRHPQPLC